MELHVMFFALGGAAAALSAIGGLSNLLANSATASSTATSKTADFQASLNSTNTAAATTTASAPPATGRIFSPAVMSSLLDVQSQQADKSRPNSWVDQLFGMVDADKDGTLSKSELQQALARNAAPTSTSQGETNNLDELFAKLDSDANGAVSKAELNSALQKAAARHPHQPHAEAVTASALINPLQAINAVTATTAATTARTVTTGISA